ncbi:hypothetical protein [Maricaulis sp.]|uniref:hypothetical protein n=1 Tax=Maricaulis sp. TaxID=1486257 RepID=UPI003296DC40
MADGGPEIPHGLTLFGAAGLTLGIAGAWLRDKISTNARIDKATNEARQAAKEARDAKEATDANAGRLDSIHGDVSHMRGQLDLLLSLQPGQQGRKS